MENTKNKLENSLIAFSQVTDIPITFFNKEKQIQWEYNSENKLCHFSPLYTEKKGPCTIKLASSLSISNQLGEPYISTCLVGLANITMPVIIKEEVQGYYVAGPIVMGDLKESIVSDIMNNTNAKGESLNKLIICLRKLKTFHPKDVSYISLLLESVVISSITTNKDYSKVNLVNSEQQQIGEHIRKQKMRKEKNNSSSNLENDLFFSVRQGNVNESKETFSLLFKEISGYEAGNISAIKTKLLSIFTILTRQLVMNDGEESDSYFYDMSNLNETTSINKLLQLSLSYIEKIANFTYSHTYTGDSQLIKSAINYIHLNYNQKLMLSDLANELHVNSSYLSMLFKKETGLTFTEHCNKFRIIMGQDLLVKTNFSLSEISGLVGYDDQSYFSKIFKRETGITPLQYRKSSK